MENPQKKIIIDEDRISKLPGELIERIMEFLPVPDAARTCVLSRKWIHVWVNYPSLVLDKAFWDDMQRNVSAEGFKDNIGYGNTVSNILLSHFGHIQKFVIHISDVARVSYKNIDSWLSYLCKNGLKELHFIDYVDDPDCYYEVPSFVFLSSELSLSFCCIRKAMGCFNNIQSLILQGVRIHSVVLTTPLLTSLSMNECFNPDTDFVFDISAPKLARLTLDDNYFFNLQPFFKCTDIEYIFLSHVNEDFIICDGKHLVDLLALWPKLSVLLVDGYCFKELARGSIPAHKDHIPPLNLRRFALWDFDLDCEKIAWILYILKNSPVLLTFKIQFGEEGNETDEPSIVNFEMAQLRTVIMKGFTASRNEVLFVNILFKCAPLLGKMLVEEDKNMDPWKQIKILKELFSLQSKYRNTEIIFAQNLAPRDF